MYGISSVLTSLPAFGFAISFHGRCSNRHVVGLDWSLFALPFWVKMDRQVSRTRVWEAGPLLPHHVSRRKWDRSRQHFSGILNGEAFVFPVTQSPIPRCSSKGNEVCEPVRKCALLLQLLPCVPCCLLPSSHHQQEEWWSFCRVAGVVLPCVPKLGSGPATRVERAALASPGWNS